MARITVEDCINKVTNRFELVALAALATNHIISGVPLTFERENDKPPVLALRGIALGHIKPELLKEELIQSYQTTTLTDEAEEEQGESREEDIAELTDYINDSYIDTSASSEEDYSFEDDLTSEDQNKF